jgi:hypothetical protein
MRGAGSRCGGHALRVASRYRRGRWVLGSLFGVVFLALQVPVKKDNGKTAMVPAFQSLETIAGEVVAVVFRCLLYLFKCMKSIAGMKS